MKVINNTAFKYILSLIIRLSLGISDSYIKDFVIPEGETRASCRILGAHFNNWYNVSRVEVITLWSG